MTRHTSAVRMPDDLHARLKAAAEERGISMNALIVIGMEDVLPRLLPPGEVRWTQPPTATIRGPQTNHEVVAEWPNPLLMSGAAVEERE